MNEKDKMNEKNDYKINKDDYKMVSNLIDNSQKNDNIQNFNEEISNKKSDNNSNKKNYFFLSNENFNKFDEFLKNTINIIINNNKGTPLKICYLIIILLVNELIYVKTFDLFFYNVLGKYTNLIFSFMNMFFICILITSMYKCFANVSNKFSVLTWVYILIYLFIIIKSFCYNPWYFPFYLLFVFINLGIIIINYLNK